MANLDALKSLHTALVDAVQGYDEAIKDAEAPDMKSTFEEMRTIHQTSHREVDGLLAAKGEKPDESGSFMATVHKTVISVRSAVTGLDRSSLKAFVGGEQHLAGAYDQAIAESAADAPLAEALRRRKDQLDAMIAKMEARVV